MIAVEFSRILRASIFRKKYLRSVVIRSVTIAEFFDGVNEKTSVLEFGATSKAGVESLTDVYLDLIQRLTQTNGFDRLDFGEGSAKYKKVGGTLVRYE